MVMNSMEMMLFMMSLISIGALLGICFELLNYRRDIRDHIGYLEEIRTQVTSTVVEHLDKIERIESKVESLDMFINSKR